LETSFFNSKPFLKWAGGKTQLIQQLEDRLPSRVKTSKKIENYIEPFIGGGAFFFYLRNNYEIKKSVIVDINPEIILGYKTIQKKHSDLIESLTEIQRQYISLAEEKRKVFFYDIRESFNKKIPSMDYKNFNSTWIERTTQLIFLNKTCFNGLFRQNSKGEFNVPFGDYKNPKICDDTNIKACNKALQNTEILNGDFLIVKPYVTADTLIYLDPPYRPISKTSSFNSYSKGGFGDEEQKRLAVFFAEMSLRGAYLILSNSDPKNIDEDDNFFDEMYNEYKIDRIAASRMINSKADKRGILNEILVTSF
jgi:DNA adenine methylase